MTSTTVPRPADLARIEKGRVTRATLVTAARDLLRRKGIENISLHAVASAAGSSVGAIQLHFGTKNGLLLAVYAEQVAEERARIDAVLGSLAGESDSARALVERLWEGYSQERVSFQLALESRAVDDPELSAQLVALVEQHVVPGEILSAAFGCDTPEVRASLSAVLAALAGVAGLRHLIPANKVDAILSRVVVMARAVLEELA
ncbi:TetR/AcrR family transcriptional regulator [Amycolatopsis minnesotensis]|uniref:TetR/AcrR family transcriptional regulator n=1 Tax=Amycolatopsis minnesotensis TaxID=337894 RepID=UPI0031CF8097